jgi:hypothetical protein
MAGAVVICLEGVLIKGVPPNGAPIMVGLELYGALGARFKLVLDSNHDDIIDIEHWLRVAGLTKHVLVLWRDDGQEDLTDLQLRDRHLATWRSQGLDIQLYITASPEVARLMMDAGVTTILLAHPTYARPEYRPDHVQGMRAWADIEAEVTEAAGRTIKLPRVDAEMNDGR